MPRSSWERRRIFDMPVSPGGQARQQQGLLSEIETFEADGAHEGTKWWKIYTLHFLFMWNTRAFEYVSIILVASAFPQGLMATSIRGMASTLSTIIFASSVGSWIDRAPNRTMPLRTSIMVNHASIIAIYFAWMLWPATVEDGSNLATNSLFGLIILLDVVQVVSATGNNLSISRDWIPALVTTAGMGSDYTLTHVNAVMARVNLFCKITSPLLLPVIISALSRIAWISLVVFTTVMVWIAEMYCLRDVSMENCQLLLSLKIQEPGQEDVIEGLRENTTMQTGVLSQVVDFIYHHPDQRLRHFCSMPVWPASICRSFLFLTVLVYSAPLITYLLQSDMPLTTVTIARASGSLMGLLATFLTPLASRYLSKDMAARNAGRGIIVRKLGSWGITGQFILLIPVVVVLRTLSPRSTDVVSSTIKSVSNASLETTLTLFGFLSLSRLFHWTYELMEQELEQSEVPASQRSTFSGTGQAICSCFDLLHWLATVAWGKPEQFKGLATASLCMVGGSAVWFGIWARRS